MQLSSSVSENRSLRPIERIIVREESRVSKVLSTMSIPTAGLSGATLLHDDLGIDSAERVELIVGLEKEFGLKLGPEAEGIKTFGELCTYLTALQSRDAGAGRVNATS